MKRFQMKSLRISSVVVFLMIAATSTAIHADTPKDRGVWLGAFTQPVSEVLAAQLDLPEGEGLVVTKVVKESPAAKAGIARHDILTAVNDKKLADVGQLWALGDEHKVGDKITIKFIRKGKPQQVEATLAQRPRAILAFKQQPAEAQADDPKQEVAYLGVASDDILPQLAEQLGLPNGEGVSVVAVQPDSAAAKAGLQRHDVIHKVNGEIVKDRMHLRQLIRGHKPGDEIKLTVVRGAKEMNIDATLGATTMTALHGVDRPNIRLRIGGNDLAPGEWFEFLPGQPLQPRDAEQMHAEMQQRMAEIRKKMKKLMELHAEGGGVLIDPMDDPIFEHKQHIPLRIPQGAKGARMSVYNSIDNEHNITVRETQDGKALLAKDRDGNVLFDGPIDTDEQLKEVPEAIREKVERMTDQQRGIRLRFEPKPDDDAKPSENEKPLRGKTAA